MRVLITKNKETCLTCTFENCLSVYPATGWEMLNSK
ncbi:MAG: hypothetical protein KDD15_15740 [Lewinella sp.]|nr:hypothetical protein [Lewinella sp.]